MNEQDHIKHIQSALIALLRSCVNGIINSLGIAGASASAKLLTVAVVLFLGLNIFFCLNMALGFLLGEWLGSMGLGFLAVVGLYALLLGLYLLSRQRIEAGVQDGVARQVHRMSDTLNTSLNQNPKLKVEPLYREAFISGEPMPYHALKLRRDEAKRQAERASQDLRRGIMYLKGNYKAVFGSMAQNAVPSLRYILPLVRLSKAAERPKPKPIDPKRTPEPLGFFERKVNAIKPYMPYLRGMYQFLSPVISALVVGKTQSWLIGKLLPKKKKRK